MSVSRGGRQGHYCDVCSISCDTAIILQNHCTSPRHLAMVQRKKRMPGPGGQSLPVPGSYFDIRPTTATPPQQERSASSQSQNPVDEEYVFSSATQRGYCHLCKIDLTSISHAQSHISGKNHAKKQQNKNLMTTGSGMGSGLPENVQHFEGYRELSPGVSPQPELSNLVELSCKVCGVTFTGPQNKAEHIRSKKHLRNVQNVNIRQTVDNVAMTSPVAFNASTAQLNFRDARIDNEGVDNQQSNIEHPQPRYQNDNIHQSFMKQTQDGNNGEASRNVFNKYQQNKFVSTSDAGNVEEEEQLIVKPLDSSGQSPSQNETQVEFIDRSNIRVNFPSNTARNLPAQENLSSLTSNSTDVSSLNAKPIAAVETRNMDRCGDAVSTTTTDDNESKINAEISSRISAVADNFSSLDIKSGFSIQTESDKCSSRFTEPYREVHNDFGTNPCLPLGRGRGILEFQTQQQTFPGKIQNTDFNPVYTSQTSPKDTSRQFTDKKENVNVKFNNVADAPVRNDQRAEETIPKSAVSQDIPQFAANINRAGLSSTGSRRKSSDVKSESEGSLEQEGIHFSGRGANNLNLEVTVSGNGLRHFGNTGNVNARSFTPGDDIHSPGPMTFTTTKSLHSNNTSKILRRNSSTAYTYDQISGTGHCFICDVEFTSHQHMQQHVTGKKHLKATAVREQLARTNVTDDALVCLICAVTFTCQESKLQHLQSDAHKQRMDKQMGLNKSESYYCDICRVPCSCLANYEQHLLGSQHRKQASLSMPHAKVAQPSYATVPQSPIQNSDLTQWYSCNVCNCVLNSYEQLEIHKNSPKHLTKLGQHSSSPNTIDQTMWHHCNVCNCKMNTLEQLRIHEKSPKHLAKLKQSGGGWPPPPPQRSTPPPSPRQYQTKHDTIAAFNRNNSVTPLDSFLSQELFPDDFLPTDMKSAPQGEKSSSNSPNNLSNNSPNNMSNNSPNNMPNNSPNNLANNTSSNSPNNISQVPSPFEIKVTDVPFIAPERFITFDPSKALTNESQGEGQSGFRARGQMSDLAFGTRNKTGMNTKVSRDSPGNDAGNIAASDVFSPGQGQLTADGWLTTVGYTQQPSNAVNPFANTHAFYCHTCKSPMNTRESYESHLKGKRHLAKVCTETAPVRLHVPGLQMSEGYVPYSKTEPRNYQCELYQKAMKDDSIIFLPTGTGKTMVSVLTMSAMLEKYPTKSVLFLVDKVLLVFQQSKYITTELGDKTFNRFNTESGSCTEIEQRKLRIAALCMGQQSTGGLPLWKHDVVIVTAGFCQNLLTKQVLRWEDFSLVVFDEAHHCEKGHPFNSLLTNYHCNRSLFSGPQRPKILGLTASPAGKSDVPKTLLMLRQLVANMGGVQMRIVQVPEHVATLAQFQSNAELQIRCLNETEEKDEFEETFRHELNVYIMFCLLRLMQISNIKTCVNIDAQVQPNMQERLINMLADEFVEREMDSIQSSLMLIENTCTDQVDKVTFSYFQCHVQAVCMARSSLCDGGVFCALHDLDDLEREEYGFSFADKFGMPINFLLQLHQSNRDRYFGSLSSHGSPGDSGSTVPADHHARHLIGELIGTCYMRDTMAESYYNHISLVLVKQRSTAYHLAELLQESSQMQQAQLNTATVVGHGGSGPAGGMSVNQQKRMLEEIKQYKYQVIIATSVAEEGVDWPECERVISMYPPSTVTALIQMRGRARRKQSKFIVLCASLGEEEKLREIIQREQNMITATHMLVEEDI